MSDLVEMVEFRTALRGYSKEDVNKYIDELNNRFSSLERELRKAVDAQKAHIADLEKKLSEKSVSPEKTALAEENKALKNEIVSLKKDLELQRNKQKGSLSPENDSFTNELIEKNEKITLENQALKQECESLSAKTGELAESIEKTALENQALKQENESLSVKTGELAESIEKTALENQALRQENESLYAKTDEFSKIAASYEFDREKSEMYDKLSSQIGTIIINANAESESILEDAIKKAKEETELLKQREVSCLNAIMSETIESILEELNGVVKSIGESGNKLNSLAKNLPEVIKNRCSDVKNYIENENCEFLKSNEDEGE